MISPGVTFRPATRDDAQFVVPLMHAIGRRDLDRLFVGLAPGLGLLDVVTRFYQADGGMFSWRNTGLALVEGVQTGFITAYRTTSREASTAWLAHTAAKIGARALLLLAWRGVAAVRTAQPQLAGSWYIAFVGVSPGQQSHGIGSSLVERSIQSARALGCSCVELDVDVDNPRAQSLYERLGFRGLRAGRQRGSSLMVATRRMVLRLPSSGSRTLAR